MNVVEMEASRKLEALGFTGIRFTGQRGDQLLYERTDGEPVLDAPIVRVRGNRVTLEAWTTQL